eukprot:12124179-Alexandrium_andersonii.AAC.1
MGMAPTGRLGSRRSCAIVYCRTEAGSRAHTCAGGWSAAAAAPSVGAAARPGCRSPWHPLH